MIKPQTIREKLADLIPEVIAEINDSYTDEILCDMCEDPTYINEAIEYLIDQLTAIKENGI